MPSPPIVTDPTGKQGCTDSHWQLRVLPTNLLAVDPYPIIANRKLLEIVQTQLAAMQ